MLVFRLRWWPYTSTNNGGRARFPIFQLAIWQQFRKRRITSGTVPIRGNRAGWLDTAGGEGWGRRGAIKGRYRVGQRGARGKHQGQRA